MLAIWGTLDILCRTGLAQYFQGYIWMLGSRLTSREDVKSSLLANFTGWKRAYHQLNYFRVNLKIRLNKKAGWLTKKQSQLFLSYTEYFLDQVKKQWFVQQRIMSAWHPDIINTYIILWTKLPDTSQISIIRNLNTSFTLDWLHHKSTSVWVTDSFL